MNCIAIRVKRVLWVSSFIGIVSIFLFYLRLNESSLMPIRWGVVVKDKLYRSNGAAPATLESMIKKHGIKVVVELLSPTNEEIIVKSHKEMAEKLGVEYYPVLMFGDGVALPQTYAEALSLIDKSIAARKPTLIYCAAGVQRTGSVVALYRILIQKLPPQLAYSEMKDYCPRKFWNKRLVEHINSNMYAVADALYSNGIIQSVPKVLPMLKGE